MSLSDLDRDDEAVDLRSIFVPECVDIIPPGSDKPAALALLVASLTYAERLPADKVNDVIEALVERESVGSTAMGNGLAFPNLRSHAVSKIVGAIGVAPYGIDFDSLDGQPTCLVVMVLAPFEQREQYTEVMARVASLLSDKTLQYSLQRPRSPEEILSMLDFDLCSSAQC